MRIFALHAVVHVFLFVSLFIVASHAALAQSTNLTEAEFNALSEKEKVDFINTLNQLPPDPEGTTEELASSNDEAFCIEQYTDKGYVRIDSGTNAVKAGEKLQISGTFFNNFSFPFVESTLKMKVFDISSGYPTFVGAKTILENFALLSGSNLQFTATYDVPLNARNGTYKVLFYIIANDVFDVSGVYASDSIGAGEFRFEVTDERSVTTPVENDISMEGTQTSSRLMYPSITSYPLMKGEENTLFSCFYAQMQSSQVSTESRLVVTLVDSDGNIIHRVEGQNTREQFIKAVNDSFVPEKTYYTFKLTAVLFDGETEVESVTRTYDCKAFGACVIDSEPAEVASTHMLDKAKMWVMVAVGFAIILLVGTILHTMNSFIDRRKKILFVSILIIVTSITLLLFVRDAFAQSVTKYIPVPTSSWGNNVGSCTNPSSAPTRTVVSGYGPAPSCTGGGFFGGTQQCTCPTGYTFSTQGSGVFGSVGSCISYKQVTNGIVRNLGVHNRCVLLSVGGDNENYRGCEVTGTVNGPWYARFIDEGDASSFICNFLCNDESASGVTSGYGAACSSGGKPGVINSANRCCTGTKYFGACMTTTTAVNTSNQGYVGMGSFSTSFSVSSAVSDIACSAPDAPVISSFTGQAGAGVASNNLANINVGTPITLSWTASNVASCSASGATDWLGTKTIPNGTQGVSADRNTTYRLTCTGFGGTTITRDVNISTVGPADLVPSLPSASSASVPRGGSVTFTTNAITNAGSEVAGPYSIGGFYLDSNGDGVAEVSLTAGDVTSNTAPGGSNTKVYSWNIPLSVPLGNYRISYIADVTNSINEGTYGESNNFSGWTTAPFTITPANCPATTISNCNLPSTAPGSSVNGSCAVGYAGACNYTCQADGTWNGSGTNSCVPTYQCVDGLDNDGDGKTDFGSGVNNDPDCTSGTDNSEGVTGTVSLTATPRVVQEGSTGTLGWTTTGSNPALCTLRGGTLNLTSLGTASGSQTVTVNALTTYTLTCGSLTKSVTFEVVPRGFET